MMEKIVRKGVLLLLAVVVVSSYVSALDVRTVRVEDLKIGDIIIDTEGDEVLVEKIEEKNSDKVTISEYIKYSLSKIKLVREKSLLEETFVGDSGIGVGSITGNAIVTGQIENPKVGLLKKLKNKLNSWISKK